MSNDTHWIKTRIAASRTQHPSVTQAVSSQMSMELAGRLSEQQLSPVDLKTLADALIADMAPAPPKPDSER